MKYVASLMGQKILSIEFTHGPTRPTAPLVSLYEIVGGHGGIAPLFWITLKSDLFIFPAFFQANLENWNIIFWKSGGLNFGNVALPADHGGHSQSP